MDPTRAECVSTSPFSTFVFLDVAYTGGDSDGSRERPFIALADAFFAAQAKNAEGVVIGGSPTFNEPLNVINGVSIHGGYSGAPDFQRDPTEAPTWDVPESFRGAPDSLFVTRLIGMRALNITLPTVVENIRIRTADLLLTSFFGPDNYGVHVDASPGLSLVNLDVQAGRGGPSLEGAEGGTGPRDPARMDGQAGTPAFVRSCSGFGGIITGGPGGVGTACVAGQTNSGFRGGFGGAVSPAQGADGQAGEVLGSGGGFGGSGSRGVGAPATSGGPGAPGSRGQAGAAGAPGGSISRSFWIADYNGAAGGPGTNGHAGGSGGGGSAVTVTIGGTTSFCIAGAGAGGGGAGGCGGRGGEAATPAGNSFGLMVVDSAGLEIVGGSYRAGDGGPGARGGAGGEGAAGGRGGPGDVSSTGGITAPAAFSGFGGNGGSGGRGGFGGNSAGGTSFGIYCHNTSVDLGETTVTPGSGGPGGTRSGTPAAPAGDSFESVNCAPAS